MIEDFLLTLIGVIAYQLVGIALFLPLEIAFPKKQITITERAAGLIFLLATTPVTAIVLAALITFKRAIGIPPLVSFHHSLWSPVLASIVAGLWIDLQFYIVHRIEHRFFWRFHAVHHSINNLSAANSFHHWSEGFMGLTIGIPLIFVDVQIGPTLSILSFFLTYQQFYIHSSSKPHFGALRVLLVDNRYHRIHHSMEKHHHDKNFGAMTPLWDWLFGTLYMPKSDEWPDVGLKQVRQPNTLVEWSTLPWRYSEDEPVANGPTRILKPECVDGR